MNSLSSFRKYLFGVALATMLLLSAPLVAMQFTHEVAWTLSDFLIMGGLLFGSGLAYGLLARKTPRVAYRVAVGIALAAAFLLFWVNAAVGVIGAEDQPANLLFFGVHLVGISGAAGARFKPRGMAWTLFAMAGAQALAPLLALLLWPGLAWGAAGMAGVLALNFFFVLLFALAAVLFRHSAQERPPAVL